MGMARVLDRLGCDARPALAAGPRTRPERTIATGCPFVEPRGLCQQRRPAGGGDRSRIGLVACATYDGWVTATTKRVLLAAPRGYCAGVDRAVVTVEKAVSSTH